MKNLETQHCSFLFKTMMKNSKSEEIKRHENIESIKKVLMSVTLQDAIDDLRETRESSGIQLQDALNFARRNLTEDKFRSFSKGFFNLLHCHREHLWADMNQKKVRAFQHKRAQEQSSPLSEDSSIPEGLPVASPTNHSVAASVPQSDISSQILDLLPSDHPPDILKALDGHSLEQLGILVTDVELENLFGEEIPSKSPLKFGGVDLSTEESKALLLHPKMRLFDNVSVDLMEFQSEKCLTKIRWKDMKNSASTSRQQQEVQYTDSNLPFQFPDASAALTSNNTLRLPSLKVSDLPTNRMVKMPDPLPNT